MLIELKDLIICFLFVGLIYSIYRNVRDEKDNTALNRRVSELECRLVVRVEDRLVLVEQALDVMQSPKPAIEIELHDDFKSHIQNESKQGA